jgi:flagellar basal-body rod protein FlgC
MGDYTATQIAAAGMTAQMARIEAAALNLANMHTTTVPGTEGYQPVTAVIRTGPTPFARVLDGGHGHLLATQAELMPLAEVTARTAYEPGHPHADSAGMVSYPAVDHTQEMLTVMTALRAYEANLAALQVTRTLAAKALEIGSQ